MPKKSGAARRGEVKAAKQDLSAEERRDRHQRVTVQAIDAGPTRARGGDALRGGRKSVVRRVPLTLRSARARGVARMRRTTWMQVGTGRGDAAGTSIRAARPARQGRRRRATRCVGRRARASSRRAGARADRRAATRRCVKPHGYRRSRRRRGDNPDRPRSVMARPARREAAANTALRRANNTSAPAGCSPSSDA